MERRVKGISLVCDGSGEDRLREVLEGGPYTKNGGENGDRITGYSVGEGLKKGRGKDQN